MMIKIEGQVQPRAKGIMTRVNDNAMLMCKGGIATIN